ncbi:SWIM zinc finger family protein [Acinetobacter courvalinii]|uniref:SWIM zinc finger family protein n=1 Tax=Acinetobacter courvalinii TaxID=280147 RepID=UPI003879DB04
MLPHWPSPVPYPCLLVQKSLPFDADHAPSLSCSSVHGHYDPFATCPYFHVNHDPCRHVV